jgi:hypothetical protein
MIDDKQFDITTIQGISTLSLDSDRLEDCLARYRAGDASVLAINRMRGYRARDISFLRDHSYVQRLIIVQPPVPFDLAPVHALEDLRSLTISGTDAELTLRGFRLLEEFRGDWHRNLGIDACHGLRTLDLSCYKPASKDLADFPLLPSLTTLVLVQGRLRSLQGISRLRAVVHVELAYLTNLESLHDLEALAQLEYLDCDVCRKLRGHDSVRGLGALRLLRYNNCGRIPSIRFLDELPALEEFRFVGTTVEDGDLSPLLRLKRVGFTNKKDYSHTTREMDAILRKKGGGAIPRLE